MNIIYIIVALIVLTICTVLLLKQRLYKYTYPMVLISILLFMVVLDVRERIVNVAVGTVQVTLKEVKDAAEQARIATAIVKSNSLASAKLIIPTFYPPPRKGWSFLMDMAGAYRTREDYITNLEQLGISDDEVIELRMIANESARRRLFEATITLVFDKDHTRDWPEHLKSAVISHKWDDAEFVQNLLMLFQDEPNSGNVYSDELLLLRALHSYLTPNPDGTITFKHSEAANKALQTIGDKSPQPDP